MKYLILYIASLVLGGAGAWLISRWGNGFGLLDKANDRSSHEGVVPKGGGIGILTAFFVSSIVLSMPKSFWIPAVILSLFSLLGDRVNLSSKLRLAIQFGAAGLFLFGMDHLLFFGLSQDLHYSMKYLVFILTVIFMAVYIVGTANYYNFIDGINGIAGITGVIGFGLLAFYASSYPGADYSLVILSICISLSCLGFLPLNMPKAKVFMGDVGSVLLGFVFAAMVVLLSKSFLDFVCLAGFLFPFYADELTTLIVRIRGGDRLTKPHRRHLYQLLANEMRIDHWKVSVGYGLLQLFVGVSILLLKPMGLLVILLLLVAYFSGFSLLSFVVRRKMVP